MGGWNEPKWRRALPGRLAMLLALIWGATHFARSTLAQQSSERVHPNTSMRSNRTSPRAPLVAQLPVGIGANPNPQPPADGVPVGGRNVQELPEMQPRNETGAEDPREQTGDKAASPQQFRVPLQQPDFQNMRIKAEDGLVSLIVRDAPLRDVLTLLAETQGLNIVTADQLTQPISVTLDRVPLNDALDAVLSVAGYTFSINRNILLVSSLNNAGTVLAPQVQGLRLEVFQLDYAMALDVQTAVTGMLSPVGNSYTIASSAIENRRPRELLAVNDLPPFLDRIRQYVAQIDLPPRQVMIEVHVLQVDLDEQNKHGVNFDQLFRRDGNLLFEMHTSGFATTNPQQAFTFRFNDGNLAAFLEMLRTTTDAKTLASPRILVLNGQQARLQVGQQLGFRVTTTTETSTSQGVEFLDVGVVMEVTPRISRDGMIMMSVRPKVSSGLVNAATGLPEEKTTELDTDILLCDHEGIMIGGLIQEVDDESQSKLAWLGELRYVGRLFQRRTTTKNRREIIITLIPRLLPYESSYVEIANEQFERADTPLLQGPLERVPRPWEPRLSDAIDNPRVIRLPRVHDYLPPRRCQNCGQACYNQECCPCVTEFENTGATDAPIPQPPSPVHFDDATPINEQLPTARPSLSTASGGEIQDPLPVPTSRLPAVAPRVSFGRINGTTGSPGSRYVPTANQSLRLDPYPPNPPHRP